MKSDRTIDTIAINTNFGMCMDAEIKGVIHGKTPQWGTRRDVRRYIGERWNGLIASFHEHYNLSPARIKHIVGGVKEWQDESVRGWRG